MHNFAKMECQKANKGCRSYEPDFKAEILRRLISGKSVNEVSKTFGIGENLLYRWKSVSKMKTKAKSTEPESSVKLIAEIAKLKAENARL